MAESSSSAAEAAKGKLQQLQLHRAHTLTIPNEKETDMLYSLVNLAWTIAEEDGHAAID